MADLNIKRAGLITLLIVINDLFQTRHQQVEDELIDHKVSHITSTGHSKSQE